MTTTSMGKSSPRRSPRIKKKHESNYTDELIEDSSEDEEQNPIETLDRLVSLHKATAMGARHRKTVTTDTYHERKPTAVMRSRRRFSWKILPIFVFAGVLCYLAMYSWKTEGCRYSVETVMSNFTRQSNDLWPIMMNVLEKEGSPVHSIVFLHPPEASLIAQCLASLMAEAFACQRAISPLVTIIKPRDVNIDGDYGQVLEKYRGNGAVIIENPTLIQEDKAQIFHTMCDDISKFNPPSLYIFTIPVSGKLIQKPPRAAREILTAAWGGLAHNILDPLLSRVLGHVITVVPERNVPVLCN